MRRFFTGILILVFLTINTGLLLAKNKNEDEKFQKTVGEYLEAMWKFYPTSATLAGFHKFDDKLEDMSNKNIEKRYEELNSFSQEFVAKIDRMKLSPELQADHQMILDALDREILKHENLVPWEYNPTFYNNIFANCIKSLLTEDFASIDTRAKSAEERLNDLTKLVKQAKENLKTPAQIYTETAIQQFPAILDFYKIELPSLIDNIPASFQAKQIGWIKGDNL